MRKNRVQRDNKRFSEEESKRKHVAPRTLSHVTRYTNLCEYRTEKTPLRRPFTEYRIEA